ncbi:MAG: hypothetical protein AAF497_26170, partial [Planctomycetota bacterium]
MRQLLKRLKPGIIDGVCIGLVGLLLIQCIGVYLSLRANLSFDSGVLIGGVHLGGVCLLSLLLIWGNFSVIKRYVFGLIAIAVWLATTFLGLRLALGPESLPSLPELFVFVLPALTGLLSGFVFRRISRIRFSNRSCTTDSQISIRELLLVTLFFAIAFATIPQNTDMSEIVLISLMGIVPFLILIQPPLSVSFWRGKFDGYWCYQIAWVVILLTGCVTYFVYAESDLAELVSAVHFLCGWLASYVYGMSVLRTLGFKFVGGDGCSDKIASAENSNELRLINVWTTVGACCLFGIALVVGWNFELRALVSDSDLTFAQRIALSRRIA